MTSSLPDGATLFDALSPLLDGQRVAVCLCDAGLRVRKTEV